MRMPCVKCGKPEKYSTRSMLCHQHYEEVREATAPRCDEEGCEKAQSAYSLCHRHYMAALYRGDPEELPGRAHLGLCEMGCGRLQYSAGLCGRHYQSGRRHTPAG